MASYQLQLIVREYNSGAPIEDFAFLINEDNTGNPNNPNNLPSTTGMASHSPVVATGVITPGTPNAGSPGSYQIQVPEINTTIPGEIDRYLITVRAAGYKVGGTHFNANSQVVLVELVKDPLPLSTLRVHVFHDNHPVNGENDIPVEQGIPGFHVIIEDTVGELTVDWFGNPLCTNYVRDGNGNIQFDGNGDPIIDPANPGGYCVTDANGDLVIDTLPRGKYEIIASPPDGTDWVQTTTIEGTPVIDAWLEEGSSGFSPREGFQTAGVWIGFVRPMDNWNDPAVPGRISGTVRTIEEWTPPEPPAPPLKLTDPVDRPWIALTDIGGTDEQVYLGRGNPDGTFVIDNVPEGLYQMAIWDENLDYIIAFYTVQIPETPQFDIDNNPQTVHMNAYNPNGDGVGIPRWFGWFSGHVFQDLNKNGLYEPGEPGIPNVELLMRFRDGSIRYTTITDNNGYYEFPEVFELEKFYVTEVGFTNMGITGATLHNELNIYDPNDPSTYTRFPDVLTVTNLNWAAKRTIVDWGKYPYDVGENGGISGIVQYATTRNEFDAHLQATEDYEPGIPDVTVNLYAYSGDPANPIGQFLQSTQTDHYQHPTGCDATDSLGNPIPDPLNMGPNCIEVPNISNEVKDGVFDGGYAFDGLPPGDYIVEVVPPPGYKIVTEEDLNTADGNALQPALPPSGCVGDLFQPQVPDQYDSPFDAFNDDGTYKPGRENLFRHLCDKKFVTLHDRQNAGTDFYLMTDNAVPIPGRIYGFLLDDLNIETSRDKIYYGEKRGVPHTPVGIRDFTGRLITMLETDENGIFEVLLPSTYVADCPIPSGVCPAMYLVVGNDPGDPGNPTPNYNPNYQTITFVFDVWPGKTTYADVAVFPITAFTPFPGGQFGQPAMCGLAPDEPQLYFVDRVFYHIANGADPNLTITGAGFGATQGTVTLGGVELPVESWTDTAITVDLPTNGDANSGPNADHPGATVPDPGPQQLLITAANGKVSPNGLTIHVRGPGYDPPRLVVPTQYPTIQDALNAAEDGDLVIVEPGVYIDPFTVDKAVKIQGYGPGAPDGLGTGGSVLDQRFILNAIGFQFVNVDPTGDYNPQIDGFLIANARDEQDIGGGLHVNSNTNGVEISNNVIRTNGGNFGGGITIGQPYLGDNNNDNVSIHHNRIHNNGGISLAGGLGIFNGADNYEIAYNDICGNYSGEYGGGISHFGLSHNGSIHHNRIYYNNAFDEGGGIIVAGELPIPQPGQPLPLTNGAGAVDIYNNLVQANLSNDDGGGIRLLQPLDYSINIFNNVVVNNVSTDLGGGIALDDASNVTLVNNTIARNTNTSTAEDSDGLPHAAGLVSEGYSLPFTNYLEGKQAGSSAPGYPDPVMFNNIFWENQAYTWDATTLTLNFDSIRDIEVFGAVGTLTGETDPTNLIGVDPLFVSPYDTQLTATVFRMEPNFIDVKMVTVGLPLSQQGDYHIQTGSPAEDGGIDQVAGVYAPCDDFDGDGRPYNGAHDIGADELVNGTLGPCVSPGAGYGVVLSPGQDVQLTVPLATQAVLNHTVTNIGGLPDAYNLSVTVTASDASVWTATVDPATTGTLNPVENEAVQVTVPIPAGVISGTVATVTLTAVSDSDPAVTASVIDTITVQTTTLAVLPQATFYLSTQRNARQLGSLTRVRNEDIVGFDETIGDYIMVFDGSDVGIGGTDVDAFDIQVGNGGIVTQILMSFRAETTLPGVGVVDDSDIVSFVPTSLGEVTAGTFSLFFDGSQVGLTTNGEDIDALHLLEGDLLVISTVGTARVPVDTVNGGGTVVARDEDLLLYQMQDPQAPSAAGGTWSLYFDGSDVGLATSSSEDIDAVYVAPDVTEIFFSTVGNVGVTGTAGVDEDVIICVSPVTGPNTACNGDFDTFFIGADFGLGTNGQDIDAIDFP
ncbi:MAG: pectin esterase [Chloroflexi bacterium]|nr:MAG: pectin esterase [Chloroflexota bacterium]